MSFENHLCDILQQSSLFKEKKSKREIQSLSSDHAKSLLTLYESDSAQNRAYNFPMKL